MSNLQTSSAQAHHPAFAPHNQNNIIMQRTLARAVQCSGIGVHSGETVQMRLLPADADTGIIFVRTDLKNGARHIPALWDHVVDTKLCTVLGNEKGGRVATVEHLMAALRAFNIDNLLIEIDAGEVPVMDGSSDPFVFLIETAGTITQSQPRRAIRILKPVAITRDGKTAQLTPSDSTGFSFDAVFNRAPIGDQSYNFTLSPSRFKNDIGRARTFGFYEEVDALRKIGLARGGSLQNAIVIKDSKIMNPEGLRYGDEFVRHKILDAVGDLALAGAPIYGQFHGHCSGHALNNQLLHALFADKSAWEFVVDQKSEQKLAL